MNGKRLATVWLHGRRCARTTRDCSPVFPPSTNAATAIVALSPASHAPPEQGCAGTTRRSESEHKGEYPSLLDDTLPETRQNYGWRRIGSPRGNRDPRSGEMAGTQAPADGHRRR